MPALANEKPFFCFSSVPCSVSAQLHLLCVYEIIALFLVSLSIVPTTVLAGYTVKALS